MQNNNNANKLEILFFYPKLYRYGVFSCTKKLVAYLSSKKFNVTIGTDNTNDDELINELSKHAKIITRKKNENKFNFTLRLINSKEYTHYIGVQGHNSLWLFIGKLLSLNFKKKIISWEHSSPFTSIKNENPRAWPIIIFIKWISSFLIDAFFCVSKEACLEVNSKIFIKSLKIHYIPNIIFHDGDIIKDDKLSNQNGQINKIVFLSIGRISEEKGLEIALAALESVDNIDWEYWIVGDGPLRKTLENQCKLNSTLKDRVYFLGWDDNPQRFMKNANVLLLPSFFEGMPTVLIESTINNLPAIAADCKTGPNEIIKNGQNGYLFKVGSVEDLKDKINLYIINRHNIKNSHEFASDFNESKAGEIFIQSILRI